MWFRKLFDNALGNAPAKTSAKDLGKLKIVRFYLKGGQIVEIDGVVDATFNRTDEGKLISWNMKFDTVENHRKYPIFFNLADVSAITTEEYNQLRDFT